MKIKQIMEMENSQLEALIAEQREKVVKARFEGALRQAKNTKQGAEARRMIAKALTVLAQRSMEK
ncbi:MAG TPA: 50S ribosomal protein L29 [Candidatus Moranbacteria bacterium]|nr:50S ribosomal protein L29 [Candidatus Moranbacteria bacterium]